MRGAGGTTRGETGGTVRRGDGWTARGEGAAARGEGAAARGGGGSLAAAVVVGTAATVPFLVTRPSPGSVSLRWLRPE